MHQITGFYFFQKGEKRFVIYSTKTKDGRFCSMLDCTGLTDQQASGRFITEHSREVDYLIKHKEENNSKIII